MTEAGRLGPAERQEALGRMGAEEFDVVVVGAGVTGSGCALDAALRGLKVALVEQRDLASGTSSRSSKLIHGGLRYLEHRDFGLVREALHERALLLRRLAPHLVRPLPILFPLTHRVWERAYAEAGLRLYDSMAGAGAVPRHRHLSRTAALALAPALRREALVGAIQYHDAQVDDARFTMTVARTAAGCGAVIATRARVVGFLRHAGRIAGVEVVDLESDLRLELRARTVINAAGVWSDELGDLAGGERAFRIRASKGVHILVPGDRIASRVAVLVRTEKSGLFVLPWHGRWLIGTTDTDWDLDIDRPAASAADVAYLLDRVNRILHTPLTERDVIGVYAGLRPLVAGDSESTTDLSRNHAIGRPLPGLVTIAGGKFTTYRVMARDAVDAATEGWGIPASPTADTPLAGAAGAAKAPEHLAQRYGSLSGDVLALARERPELGRPLAGAPDYLAAEIVYAASHEGALHLDDVLARRTRIAIEYRDGGVEAARPAAELMAPVLGWDRATVDREVAGYTAQVEAERRAAAEPDDAAAEAALSG